MTEELIFSAAWATVLVIFAFFFIRNMFEDS
jgi:hypothetical protein